MRPLVPLTSIAVAVFLSGCERTTRAGTFTLYRNSSADPQLRVHYATFDADESSSTYNMANCQMAARLLNANIRKLNYDLQPVGFWCESGAFREDGDHPVSFDAAFPTDGS